MLTGCRKSEILSLRWEHVDLERGELRLPDSKTGAKIVHLGNPAIVVLRCIDREDGNPWVIAGAKQGEALSDVYDQGQVPAGHGGVAGQGAAEVMPHLVRS